MTAPVLAGPDLAGPDLAGFRRTLEDARSVLYTRTERVALASIEGWRAGAGAIRHRSGRFFSVEGLAVRAPGHPVTTWDQPIIRQPETGILGMLVREVDGELHCLVQLKAEPGNPAGLQVSPTVQATRSNYTAVHRGAPVPYLRYFTDPGAGAVVVDVLQSEHGSWFLGKHNRNVVVRTTEDVPAAPGFCWLRLGALHRLLAEDDLVNADTRSVLACLPAAGIPQLPDPGAGDGFAAALSRSCTGAGAAHPAGAVREWIDARRERTRMAVRSVPLDALRDWRRDDAAISHRDGRFFDVIGVRVQAVGREVGCWSQPMIAPHGTGLVALLVTRVRGALHVLVEVRAEPGCAAGAELGPTVQCTPRDHAHLPAAARPRFLDVVARPDPAAVRFDTVLADEGGRFYRSRCRHLVVETGWIPEPPSHRWLTVHQLAGMLRHGPAVSMQARSLLACLSSICVSSVGGAR